MKILKRKDYDDNLKPIQVRTRTKVQGKVQPIHKQLTIGSQSSAYLRYITHSTVVIVHLCCFASVVIILLRRVVKHLPTLWL